MRKFIKGQTDSDIRFWQLNILGWVLFFIYSFFYFYSGCKQAGLALGAVTVKCLTGFVIIAGLYWLLGKLKHPTLGLMRITLSIALLTITASVLWYLVFRSVNTVLLPGGAFGFDNRIPFFIHVHSVFWYIAITSIWSFNYFIGIIWKDLIEYKKNELRARNYALNSQLQVLKYQLDPHFLFNTLNSLKSLIYEDKGKAKKMITDLAELLKAALVNKENSYTTLKKEIDTLRYYFSIIKVRFEDKLSFTFDISPVTKNHIVLNYMLQPIIENAVAQAMQLNALPLVFRIKSSMIDETLLIQIIYNGTRGNDMNEVGIANIKKRLDLAFPKGNLFYFDYSEENVYVNILIYKSIN